jgi:hypothetical protein
MNKYKNIDDFLNYTKRRHGSDNTLLRILMNKEERRYANLLANQVLLIKGHDAIGNSLSKYITTFYQ